MSTRRPSDCFYSTLIPFVGAFNSALQEAYEAACDNFETNKGIGSNRTTFGTDLYAFANSRLQEHLEGAEIRLTNPRTMTFQIGEYFLECRSVSSKVGANIAHCFPSKDQALSVCDEQIPLFNDEDSILNERNFVLAHMGNADEGFGNAYLCIRRRVGKSVSWAFTEEIFNVENDFGIKTEQDNMTQPPLQLPQAKEIQKAKIVRKKSGIQKTDKSAL